MVVAEHPVLGILELMCWMCGYETAFLKMAMDTDFVMRFFDRYLSIQSEIIDAYYTAVGPYCDITTSGDDFGTQNGPLISPAMFRELVAPYFRERIERTKSVADCLYWHHSCGSVTALLDDIVECGVDILNPVQVSADGMDPSILKNRWGDKLVFWGGMDIQQLMNRGTPLEVAEELRRLVSIFGAGGGGYVVACSHELQSDAKPENLAAMVDVLTGTVNTDP